MITPLDALFKYAYERHDLNQWFHDEDMAQDYRDNVRYAGKDEQELLNVLEGETLETFKRYQDHRDSMFDHEYQLLFREALALGIYLGSLSGRC